MGLQLGAGLAWQFHPSWALFAEYRFTHLNPGFSFPTNLGSAREKREIKTRRALFGISYRFDFSPSPPSPAPRVEGKPVSNLASLAASNERSASRSSSGEKASGATTPTTQEQPKPTDVQQSGPVLTEPKEAVQSSRALRGVRVTQVDKSTTVSILGDGPITNYKAFKLDQPARFVIDLPGVVKAYSLKSILVKSDELKQIRIGQHPDKIRVVLDLAQGGSTSRRIVEVDNGLQIVLGENQ